MQNKIHFQLFLALCHTITLCVLLYEGSKTTNPMNFQEITYNKPLFDDNETLTIERSFFMEVNLMYLDASFCFITIIAHLCYTNVASLDYRWLEYSISASIMSVLIALMSGVFDIFTLILIFSSMAMTMVFGYLSQKAYEKNSPWLFLFSLGCIPYTTAWFVIISQFLITIKQADVPLFVYAIIFIMYGFFSSFAVVQYAAFSHWFNNTDNDVLNYMDRNLHILSLTSKWTLSWLIFFGLKR